MGIMGNLGSMGNMFPIFPIRPISPIFFLASNAIFASLFLSSGFAECGLDAALRSGIIQD